MRSPDQVGPLTRLAARGAAVLTGHGPTLIPVLSGAAVLVVGVGLGILRPDRWMSSPLLAHPVGRWVLTVILGALLLTYVATSTVLLVRTRRRPRHTAVWPDRRPADLENAHRAAASVTREARGALGRHYQREVGWLVDTARAVRSDRPWTERGSVADGTGFVLDPDRRAWMLWAGGLLRREVPLSRAAALPAAGIACVLTLTNTPDVVTGALCAAMAFVTVLMAATIAQVRAAVTTDAAALRLARALPYATSSDLGALVADDDSWDRFPRAVLTVVLALRGVAPESATMRAALELAQSGHAPADLAAFVAVAEALAARPSQLP